MRTAPATMSRRSQRRWYERTSSMPGMYRIPEMMTGDRRRPRVRLHPSPAGRGARTPGRGRRPAPALTRRSTRDGEGRRRGRPSASSADWTASEAVPAPRASKARSALYLLESGLVPGPAVEDHRDEHLVVGHRQIPSVAAHPSRRPVPSLAQAFHLLLERSRATTSRFPRVASPSIDASTSRVEPDRPRWSLSIATPVGSAQCAPSALGLWSLRRRDPCALAYLLRAGNGNSRFDEHHRDRPGATTGTRGGSGQCPAWLRVSPFRVWRGARIRARRSADSRRQCAQLRRHRQGTSGRRNGSTPRSSVCSTTRRRQRRCSTRH